MPSTIVHVALAGLVGTALLGDRFDAKGILVVLAACAVIDLDTLVGIYVPGTHRAAFHNVFVVLVPAALLYWDANYRDRSLVRDRWGDRGYRVAWVTLVAVLFAHVLLDAFFNGVNLFWPLHDRFYDLSGHLLVSNERGIVQTFVEVETETDGSRDVSESTRRGTTEDTHYYTGFDTSRDEEPENVERIFPIAGNGERFVLVIAGFGTVAYRLWEERGT